jgi:hypothetical protein
MFTFLAIPLSYAISTRFMYINLALTVDADWLLHPLIPNTATSAGKASNPRLKAWSCGSPVLLKVAETISTGFYLHFLQIVQ